MTQVHEENGHLWRNYPLEGDWCVHCGRRIEHYQYFLDRFVEGESSFDQMVDLVCDTLIDRNPKNSEDIEPVGWGTYFRIQPLHGEIVRSSFDENGEPNWYISKPNPEYIQYNRPSRKNKASTEIPSPPGYYTGKNNVFHPQWQVEEP